MCYRECRCCRLNLSLTSKFGNDSLANDSIVPYSCRHCTPVTLCWMVACAHTKNLPSAYMVRARPSGSDRPGQAIKSLFIPLVFYSSALPLPPSPLCRTKSWRAGRLMTALLSASYPPPTPFAVIGLHFFPHASAGARCGTKQENRWEVHSLHRVQGGALKVE